MQGTPNREAWLTTAADALAKTIFAEAGLTVPATLRLTCGFPSRSINAQTDIALSAGPVMLGADSAWRLIYTFINGYRNGKKAAQ